MKRSLIINIAETDAVDEALHKIREDAGVASEYPREAVADAQSGVMFSAHGITRFPDHTDIPFVTIDPEGSRDLDQAIHIERTDFGYRVYYAIAHLPLYVRPGGELDAEVRRRGVTVYLPDGAVPLHPEIISAGAGSLLAGTDRPAYLWKFELDENGEVQQTTIELALVRSRAQLSYQQVQDAYDAGLNAGAESGLPPVVPPEFPMLLGEVGEKRTKIEVARGGISLNLPEQRIERVNGGYKLAFRKLTDVENWNAQISLMTGMEAAKIMLKHNVGLLRTLPPATNSAMRKLRKVADLLGLDWGKDETYAQFVRRLEPSSPAALGFMNEAVSLFRGSGYLALPKDEDVSTDKLVHAAIAAPYAHVTAPLRRLADRFALIVVHTLSIGEEIPQWVLDALPELPALMAEATTRANMLESRAITAVESLVLRGREGEEFDAVVVDAHNDYGDVILREPAVEAKVEGEVEVGEQVRVRLDRVNTQAIFKLA